MFLLEDARGKCIWSVSGYHRDGMLNDDRAPIEFRRHQMHGDAAHFHSVLNRLLLGIEPRERRQQRRMDVQNLVGERVDQPSTYEAHESGQTHQPNITRLQLSRESLIVVVTRGERTMREHDCFDARGTRAREALRIRAVRDDDGDAGLETALRDGVDERLQIAAAAGNENTQSSINAINGAGGHL